jgi:hypothetical protein
MAMGGESVCTVIHLPFKTFCGLTVLPVLHGHLFITKCVFLDLMVIVTPSADGFPAPKAGTLCVNITSSFAVAGGVYATNSTVLLDKCISRMRMP